MGNRTRHRITSSLAFAVVAVSLGGASPALAQMGMGPGGMSPGMNPGMGPPPQNQEKENGPAEAAPEEEAQGQPQVEPEVGYAAQQRRRTQVIELDGYFRVRGDFFHDLNLGQGYIDNGDKGTPPFPTPLECGTQFGNCSEHNLGEGNMRLRLEPTINISDQVRVMSRLDVFDNVIMGSTPDSMVSVLRPDLRNNGAQAAALATTQQTPEVGVNTYKTAIRPKLAWAEVDSQLGSLRFGRMPWHFGRGIYFNNGSCPDCDDGTVVDRIMAITQVYGHQLALSWDFGPQGYTADMINLGRLDLQQPPLDLSQNDDVLQLTAALTKIDDPRHWRERIANGEVVINYGAQLVYRNQGKEVFGLSAKTTGNLGTQTGQGQDPTLTREDVAGLGANNSNSFATSTTTVEVGALVFIPSLWFKLGWKALTLEFEGTAVAGRMKHAGPLRLETSAGADGLSIFEMGWVLASELRLYKDSLFIGFETGGATGDQAEVAVVQQNAGVVNTNTPPTIQHPYLNYRYKFVPQPPGDSAKRDFLFSPDYHVDEIFFRRIMGTVTNAVYIKPSIAYWLDVAESRQLGLSGAAIYSMAMVPVSTPGNSINYGLELDIGLTYRNTRENFYAGITWGVFWPFAALSRPTSLENQLYDRAEGANAAQILRTFLGVKF